MLNTREGKRVPRCLSIGLIALALGCISLLSVAEARAACDNEQFRSGPSAGLPDCRAYELVTPADSDGREPSAINPQPYDNLFRTDLVSPVRDSVLFAMFGAPLADPPEPNGNQDIYQTVRGPSGWETVRRVSPSGEQAVSPTAGGISANHEYAVTEVGPRQSGELEGGTLADDGIATYLGNPDGSFELLGVGSLGAEPQVRARFISPGGGHIIFATEISGWCQPYDPCEFAQLEPDAPPSGTYAVYDRAPDGPTHVISLLPGNVTPAAGENARYEGASADGSVVAFRIGGTLYLRVNDAKTEEVAGAAAEFSGLSNDGSTLFYVAGGDIHRFEVATEQNHAINTTGDAKVVTVSEDGSTVYFISPSLLDGSAGIEGQPNLYVWSTTDEAVKYVATVAESDLSGSPALANWTSQVVSPETSGSQGPGASSARTDFTGSALAFESRAQLTSLPTEGHREIYRYDRSAEEIACASCNPSGEPPLTDARFESGSRLPPQIVVYNLSSDGTRVFFETTEGLVRDDIDGTNDIYEWHQGGPGEPPDLNLISSGHSAEYNLPDLFGGSPLDNDLLFGISPDGSNVMFSSRDPLVGSGGRGGVMAIFDARINGGFPEPLGAACMGRECLGAYLPATSNPGSSHFAGKGNVKPKRRHCKRSSRKKNQKRKHRGCGGRSKQKHKRLGFVRAFEEGSR